MGAASADELRHRLLAGLDARSRTTAEHIVMTP